MNTLEHSEFAELFLHSLRAEWGLAVLSHELDGKRHYVFQDGRMRAFASTFDGLMTPVAAPTPEQYALYARLRKLSTSRRARPDQGARKDDSGSFEAQLVRLHRSYQGGLSDEQWAADYRAGSEAAPGRDVVVAEAKAELSSERLAGLLSAASFEEAWGAIASALLRSRLVPAAQLRRRLADDDRLRELAEAACLLLSDAELHVDRFDRYVAALTAVTGKPPSWELATAPMALVYPREHVCVTLTTFRRQAKVSASIRAIAVTPSGVGYAAVLAFARTLVHKLTEHGEAPRDLLDLRDFMAFTLAPVPKPTPVAKTIKQ